MYGLTALTALFMRPSARVAGVVALVAAAATITATAATANQATTSRSLQAGPGGITLVGGGTFAIRSPEQLTQAADKVIEATVTTIGPSQWNTTDGQRPAGATVATLPRDGYFIYTPISAQVTHGWKNATSGQKLTFDSPGGQVGPDVYIAQLEPTYQVGESVLLYLDTPVQTGKRTITFAGDAFQITPTGRAVGLYTHADLDLQDVRARIAHTLGK